MQWWVSLEGLRSPAPRRAAGAKHPKQPISTGDGEREWAATRRVRARRRGEWECGDDERERAATEGRGIGRAVTEGRGIGKAASKLASVSEWEAKIGK